jgi:hypothetical protein
MIMTSSLKGKLIVFSIFLVGILTGVLVMSFYENRLSGQAAAQTATVNDREERANRAQRNVRAFNDYLGLSQEQRDSMAELSADMRSELRALRDRTQPEFEAIEEQFREDVRALLTPEQRQKYDEFRQQRQQREREQRERRNNNNSNKQ